MDDEDEVMARSRRSDMLAGGCFAALLGGMGGAGLGYALCTPSGGMLSMPGLERMFAGAEGAVIGAIVCGVGGLVLAGRRRPPEE